MNRRQFQYTNDIAEDEQNNCHIVRNLPSKNQDIHDQARPDSGVCSSYFRPLAFAKDHSDTIWRLWARSVAVAR